jgi:hypothetical protein
VSAQRTALALILCLGTALSLAACGGGDDGDVASASSSAELIKQADAICEREDNEIAKDMVTRFGEDRLGPAPKAEERAFVTETVIPGIQAQVDGLSELEVPGEDGGQFDEFLAAMRKGLQQAQGDPLELTVYGDRPRRDPVFNDALRLADKIGFDDCTEGEPDIPG